MLKGVNKLIIEVSNPESDFFERAIFFVKPEKSNTVTRELSENVSGIMNKAEAASKSGRIKPRKPRTKKHSLLKFAGAAGVGAMLASLLIKLIG